MRTPNFDLREVALLAYADPAKKNQLKPQKTTTPLQSLTPHATRNQKRKSHQENDPGNLGANKRIGHQISLEGR